MIWGNLQQVAESVAGCAVVVPIPHNDSIARRPRHPRQLRRLHPPIFSLATRVVTNGEFSVRVPAVRERYRRALMGVVEWLERRKDPT